MTGKKQKTAPPVAAKAAKEPSHVEVPNLTPRDAGGGGAKQTITMLDYEGSPVVTYRVGDKSAKPGRSRDAS